MLPPRPCFASSVAALAIVVLAGAPSRALAQDFSLRVAEGGQALSEVFFPPAAVGTLKGGFYFGVDGMVTYDSNFFIDSDYTESELTTQITPWIVYRTDPEGRAEFSMEARYAPDILVYANNSDLDGVDNNGEVSFKFQGSRTAVSVYANYSEVSSSDRIAGGFIQGSILTYGIAGSYQLAPRTAILAGWSASMSDYTSGGRSGADVYMGEVAGLWDASERLRLGPSLRYTVTESDSTGTRDAVGLLAMARYRLGQRIVLDADVGIEVSKNSRMGGGWETGPAGGLAAEYIMNERWTFRGAIRYSTVPSPNNLNYLVNDLSFSTAIIRNFERSSLELGSGLSFTDYEAVGAVAGSREDEQYFSAYLAYRRELIENRMDFESMVRGATNNGQKDWSQWLVSVGLNVEF